MIFGILLKSFDDSGLPLGLSLRVLLWPCSPQTSRTTSFPLLLSTWFSLGWISREVHSKLLLLLNFFFKAFFMLESWWWGGVMAYKILVTAHRPNSPFLISFISLWTRTWHQACQYLIVKVVIKHETVFMSENHFANPRSFI